MAHWQLSSKAEAHQWYDKAIKWIQQKKPKGKSLEELRRFRAEAAPLLAVPEEPSARKEKPKGK